MCEDTRKSLPRQLSADRARLLADACYAFLKPLLVDLHTSLDRRLIANLLALVFALVRHRDTSTGLLLSELGGHLLSPAQAPAGTKRLSRLLHSERWQSEAVLHFLWQTADQRVHALLSQHEMPLVVWDESVLEKPESLKLEGLCPVRSTKAVRLKRIKPGYFNPPGGRPICVPGWNWLAVLVMGQTGTPTLASLAWWTTRGERAETKRTVEYRLLRESLAGMGLAGVAYLGSGLCGVDVVTGGHDLPTALGVALAQSSASAQSLGTGEKSLGTHPRETLLGASADLGCPPPL